jgi:uncharacterized cupredoxin-like copper-binding protein
MRGDLPVRRAVAVLVATASLTGLVGCTDDGPRTEVLGIHHSAYSRSAMTVRAGQRLTVDLRNDDPIEHEWIVGDAVTHLRHRSGTEPVHDARPTEVSVPAGGHRITTVVFDEPGDYEYICHLPGHEAYGMVGVLHVV